MGLTPTTDEALDAIEDGGLEPFFGGSVDYDDDDDADDTSSATSSTAAASRSTGGDDSLLAYASRELGAGLAPPPPAGPQLRRRRPLPPLRTLVQPVPETSAPLAAAAAAADADEQETPYFADYTRPPRGTVARWVRDKSDSYELWKHDVRERYQTRCNALVRARRRFCVVCVGFGLLAAAALAAYAYATRNAAAFVDDRARVTYARHGHAGVDLHARSSTLACTELAAGFVRADSTSLERMRDEALELARRDALPCVCAPMVRARTRYMLLATSGDEYVHAYNVALDPAWRDASTAGGDEVEFVLAEESQRHLFPHIAADVVLVPRRTAVRLTYRDGECAAGALIVRGAHAFCAQACLDLFEGRSVYDVAVNETAE